MKEQRQLWMIVLVVSGLVATFLVLVRYDAALDICDPTHQSPNTAYSWTIAIVSILIPLAVAGLSRRRWLLALALGAAALELAVWQWALSGPGTCGVATLRSLGP